MLQKPSAALVFWCPTKSLKGGEPKKRLRTIDLKNQVRLLKPKLNKQFSKPSNLILLIKVFQRSAATLTQSVQ